ncbi:MAG: nuclear transport factor 2 family protein [Flavobacteriales bacterium]|nr:nuclear transport factor 2 family protein [Flavobacteriales bacterium]
MKFLIAITLIGALNTVLGNSDSLVIATTQKLFDGIAQHDSNLIKSCMDESAELRSVFKSKDGEIKIHTENRQNFIRSIMKSKKYKLEERIISWSVHVDGLIASVWTPYEFYINDSLSHSGTNALILKRSSELGWRIVSIIDSRTRGEKLPSPSFDHLNELVNSWHQAASVADETTFFGLMDIDGIYIGTDSSERWLRDDLREWSEKYFKRDTAWHFEPIDREWSYSEDLNVAWWDERLVTWMGVCRGSGVLEKKNGNWKIMHYHLSVTVPNDKIKQFIELVE